MRSWYFFRKFLSFNYNFSLRDDLDETDSSSGKVLPQSDYLKKVSLRKDIFTSQSARILYASVAVCLIIAVIAGVWLSTHETVEITTDFFEDMPEERGAKIVRSLPEVNVTVHTHPQGEGSLLKKGAGGRTGGGGNPRARVTREGVLGITSGNMQDKTIATADIFGKGGYATGIDALLQGNAGLKIKGSGGAGRRGAAGIGYGAGYGSGFGGGSGGIDDLVGSIMSAELGLKREKQKHKEPSITWKRSGITANTSRLSIGERDTLPLKGSQITVQVDGFRARVLIDCYYYNDRNRMLEGTFKLRLPNEASPYFFAFGETVLLDKDKRYKGIPFLRYKEKGQPLDLSPEDIMRFRERSWSNPKEARMVPKEKAAFAYRETVNRRVDPALMEWAGADIFNCSVYPLQPRKLHRIVIGYDVNLLDVGNDKLFSLPVPKLDCPLLIDFDIAELSEVKTLIQPPVKAGKVQGRKKFSYENPDAGEVTIRYAGAGSMLLAAGESDEDQYFTASFQPALPDLPDKSDIEDALFLVDISLSSNPDKFNVWLKMTEAILNNNRDVIKRFNVLFFNIETFWWESGLVLNTVENVKKCMKYAHTLSLEGATDIEAALTEAATPAWKMKQGVLMRSPRNIFLLSDGAITWGEDELYILSSKIENNDRLYAYRTGLSGTDLRVLENLTRESGGALFSVTSEDHVNLASRAFRSKSWRIVDIAMNGASDILIAGNPRYLYNGQHLLVAGRGNPGKNAKLSITVTQGTIQKNAVVHFRHIVKSDLAQRAYGQIATAFLEELEGTTEKYAKSYATYFRVPGQYCSLLMLETEMGYKRFNIKPEQDYYIVKYKPITGIMKEIINDAVAQLVSPKKSFTAWLNRLSKMPGMSFSLPTALEVIVESIPESHFTVTRSRVTCKSHEKGDVPQKIVKELTNRELDYDIITEEMNRRRGCYGRHDAMKIVSSLVEHNPGNSVVLCDVAYSAMELGLDGQAFHLFRRVIESRPYEPQAYHALAQVLTKMGKYDLAVIYYEILLAADWQQRFGDLRNIVTLDYAHLIRKVKNGGKKVWLRDFIHDRLETLSNRFSFKSADLIVTIAWNTDNTDIDLHVHEPTGEECYYSNNRTRIGGFLTKDVTQGYGPEMYTLQNAPSGEYTIMARNYSSNRNRTDVRTKIYSTIYQNWGMKGEKVIRKVVTLKGNKERKNLLVVKI